MPSKSPTTRLVVCNHCGLAIPLARAPPPTPARTLRDCNDIIAAESWDRLVFQLLVLLGVDGIGVDGKMMGWIAS